MKRSPDLELRAATSADLDLLYSIRRAAMGEYVRLTWGEWDETWQLDYFRKGFSFDRARVILADGQVVGTIDTERQSEGWHLNVIEIAPERQNRGIGTALVTDLLARARSEGCAVELQVLKVNPARGLYVRLGFEQTGETNTHYRLRIYT